MPSDLRRSDTRTKAVAALTALKALQEDAKRKGLDKMTMDEINVEVAALRGIVRQKQPKQSERE
jgi:hypothetical protein